MLKQFLWALAMFLILQASLWTREVKYGKSKDPKKRILSHSLNCEVSFLLAGMMFFAVGDAPLPMQTQGYSVVIIPIAIVMMSLLLGVLNYAFTYWVQMKKGFPRDLENDKFHVTAILLNILVLLCGFFAMWFWAMRST